MKTPQGPAQEPQKLGLGHRSEQEQESRSWAGGPQLRPLRTELQRRKATLRPPQPPANWVPGAEGGPHHSSASVQFRTTLHGRVPSREQACRPLTQLALLLKVVSQSKCQQQAERLGRALASQRRTRSSPGSPSSPGRQLSSSMSTPHCGLQGRCSEAEPKLRPRSRPRPSPAAGAGATGGSRRAPAHLLPPRLWWPPCRGRRRAEGRGGRRTRVSNRSVAAASAAGRPATAGLGTPSSEPAGQPGDGGRRGVGITKLRVGTTRCAGINTWDRARAGAYLHRLAQLLTPPGPLGKVRDPDPHLGTCHEGGRAGPEGAQALGPGFPAERPHGRAHRSL